MFNSRVCVCCSSQEDLSMPIVEEDIDGLSGLLFPFYDADTHMLYLAGKVSAASSHCREIIFHDWNVFHVYHIQIHIEF